MTATTPVEYRIYGFGAGTSQGLLQVDNIALTFDAVVPEPSVTATLLISVLLLGTGARCKIRSASSLSVR